jgi:hypothetical protein
VLLCCGTVTVSRARAQTPARDPASGTAEAPHVGGVGLGDLRATVLQALGPPERRQTSLGFLFWDYPARGMSLMWDRDSDGVRVIVMRTPAAGAVEGVRVGDRATLARERWGTPTRVRQEGRFLDFVRQSWICSVEVSGGKITEMTLMRGQ